MAARMVNADYRPPIFYRNGHVSTILPKFFRKPQDVYYQRQRIETPDQDFLDVDFSLVGGHRIAIVLHGLEGDSDRGYMKGMIRALNAQGWDAAAVNMRGCSGEPNRLYSSYHSGKSDDLECVINWLEDYRNYRNFVIVGFSLGGNIALKFAGEQGAAISAKIAAVAAISVPCDLQSTSEHLRIGFNRVYLRRFVRSLQEKALVKKSMFPDAPISVEGIKGAQDFHDYDNLYTAPAHGYASAEDYWQRCSSKPFIPRIEVPTLLINAANDPFLPNSCYPVEEARNHPYFKLEIPQWGGHVGFPVGMPFNRAFWHESRVVDFFHDHI